MDEVYENATLTPHPSAFGYHLLPQEKAYHRPTVHLKGATHYTLRDKRRVKKDREREILCPFAVGANCVRPRAFTERPYEFVLHSR